MLNFLKRFLWPSRISQESIGAMLFEQQQELLAVQSQAQLSAEYFTQISAKLDLLKDIDASLNALQTIKPSLEVIQPHLFDIQYALKENTQMLSHTSDVATEHRDLSVEHLKFAEAIQKNTSENFDALESKIETEMQWLAKNNVESIETGTAATQSAINALSGNISRLNLALSELQQKTGQTDLSPVISIVQNLVEETQLAVTNSAFENRNLLLHELSTQQTDIKEVKDSVLPVASAIDALKQKIEQEALNTQNKSDENRNLTIHEVTTNSSTLNAVANKLTELSQNFNDTKFQSPDSSSADFTPVLAAVQNLAAETKLSVTNSGFESRNIMLHEITTQQTDIKELKNSIFELSNALHTLDLKISHESVRQSAEIVSAFSGLSSKPKRMNSLVAPSPKKLSFYDALNKAKKDNPKIFPLWFERLEELKSAFEAEGKHGNAANAADAYSNVFKSFVEGHAHGTILDVGCGVHGKPHYLHAFSDSQIAGLDPLKAIEPVNFVRHVGIGEYLPWENNSFDTIISATAIDHVLSLEKSFEEMVRILKPEGQILMWVGSVDGSKKYTPHAKDYEPADRFHLFHIDKAWFEPELEKYFHIGSQINLWLPQHEHIFYQLTAK